MKEKQVPFLALYNDDLTHIHTCESPYHKIGEDFREDMIVADVDEVADAGFDAHLLQPGQGWTPLWQSDLYPYEEHYHWWHKRYGGVKTAFDKYLLAGNDLVDTFVKRCRTRIIAPFVSLRMNDCHGKEYADFSKEDMQKHDIQFPATFCISRFYSEHPEYRLFPDPEDYRLSNDVYAFKNDQNMRFRVRHARGFNWAIEEVRAHKLSQIEELCRKYDIDGIELDFIRHPYLFRDDMTEISERKSIMSKFIGECRYLLDSSSRNGRRRFLAIRLPNEVRRFDGMGIDLQNLTELGVDMLTLSCHYNTTQVCDIAEARKLEPDMALYFEFSFMTQHVKRKGSPGGERRMLTAEQLQTAAHLAYTNGATGISAFNFMYYRPYVEWANLNSGDMDEKPGCEPPFELIEDLKSKENTALENQHYFRAFSHDLNPDEPLSLSMEMAQPAKGWRERGRLRIHAEEAFSRQNIVATVNGKILENNNDAAPIYPNPYTKGDDLGDPEEWMAWTAPAEFLREGENRISLQMNSGEPIKLLYLDLAILAKS